MNIDVPGFEWLGEEPLVPQPDLPIRAKREAEPGCTLWVSLSKGSLLRVTLIPTQALRSPQKWKIQANMHPGSGRWRNFDRSVARSILLALLT